MSHHQLQSFDGGKIGRCTYSGVTVAIAIFDHTKYLDICKELCFRLNHLKEGNFELSYCLGGCSKVLLHCDMDVRMMYLSLSAENISFVDILVSDFEKDGNGQNATSSAVLTSESSNLVDENEFLGYFGQETPKRYASYEWRFYIKEIGQKFEGGVEEFRVKLLKYAAEIGFEFVYVHNDKERITVECVNKCSEECGWRAHASRCSASGFFYLRSLNNIHNCKGVLREQHAKMMCSKVVSSVVIDMLREKRNIKPSDIMSSFKLDYGFDISYYLAWYGRELAKGALHGDDLSSYGQLTWYIDSLMSTNPDTHCVLECAGESSRFKRLFVCFGGCIEGFRYCRPVLFLDGTFLKGKFKGQLLGATAKNGNQGFFPFAFAIVDSENEENWSWFMQNLHTVLAPQGRILTFISDRCIGLIKAVKDIFPTAHHGFCYFHLKQNLLSKFPASFGKIYRDRIIFLFMKCAYTPTVTGFHYYMKILVSEGGKRVLQFLKNLPLKNWANAYFEGLRYGEMCNNVAESFNAWIVEERSMSICEMVDAIRIKEMNMSARRSRESEQWSSHLCPQMLLELNKNLDVGRHWNVSESSKELYEVHCKYSCTVSLKHRLCSCRQWQLKGFPCSHALAVMQKASVDIYDYIDDYFTTKYFRKAYSFPIKPIPSIEKALEEVEDDFVVIPPITKKQAGRPKGKRSRSDCDGTKRTVTCSRCGGGGHNKATCSGII